MTKDDERIKDWRSTGRKRARAVLQKLVDSGDREYCCAKCGWTPDIQSRSSSLDVNHINKDVTDVDPVNLEYLCRPHHYEADRATAKGISTVEEDYGYQI